MQLVRWPCKGAILGDVALPWKFSLQALVEKKEGDKARRSMLNWRGGEEPEGGRDTRLRRAHSRM